MTTRSEELESLITQRTRDFVGKRAKATTQYAEMLSEYGKGKLDVQELGTKVMGLMAKEAFAYSGDVVEVATEYWKGLARVFDPGGSVTIRSKKAPAKKKPAKKRAAPAKKKPAKKRAAPAKKKPAKKRAAPTRKRR